MERPKDWRKLLNGEKAAWDRFVRDHAGVIFGAVRGQLVAAGRSDDVEDVVQEVFVKLCRNDFRLLRNYDPQRAKVTTWLTVIATTTSIDHLRRQRSGQRSIDEVPESVFSVETEPALAPKIPDGLLSARQSAVMTLLYDREMEVAEAAELLGIDPQTVRSMHHKALTKLRSHFQRELQ